MWTRKSAILETVHDTDKGLHRAGVMDQCLDGRIRLPLFAAIVPREPEQINFGVETWH